MVMDAVIQPDNENCEDALLVSKVQRGDKDAFRLLANRYGMRYRALAFRFLGDMAKSEDVVQEAFVKFWTHSHTFDPARAKFTTWFHRVVVNRCLDEKRKKQFQALPEGFEQEDGAVRADKKLEGDAAGAQLQIAMAGLSERQQTAVTLSYFDGLSNMEAANVMELNIKAYESLLVRARSNMRKALQADQGDLLAAFV
jgi:RNA polymerase sigma-70 factor (ECF subfamily)